MKIKLIYWIGIGSSLLVLIVNIILYMLQKNMNLFLFLIGIAFTAATLPFIIELVRESKRKQKINEMFLEFSRNLAESVSTGTPVSKSIVNLKKKNYGPLSPYVEKLANQIALGIPVNKALQTLAIEVNSPTVSRAVTLISEAERAGGDIDYILDSSAKSIAEVEKLKKERRAAIYSLVVQGYLIFFIFIAVMLIMQFKILPLTNSLGSYDAFNADFTSFGAETPGGSTGGATERFTPDDFAYLFLSLLITQGFFAGLVIGKLTEGNLKSGLKHSFILVVSAFLISTGVRVLLVPVQPIAP